MWQVCRETAQNACPDVIPLEVSNAGLIVRLENYKGGSTIVQQGDPLDQLMWVQSGSATSFISFGETHVSSHTIPGVPHSAGIAPITANALHLRVPGVRRNHGNIRIVAHLTAGDS